MLARLTTEVADGVHGGPAAGTFGALLDDWVERESRAGRPRQSSPIARASTPPSGQRWGRSPSTG